MYCSFDKHKLISHRVDREEKVGSRKHAGWDKQIPLFRSLPLPIALFNKMSAFLFACCKKERSYWSTALHEEHSGVSVESAQTLFKLDLWGFTTFWRRLKVPLTRIYCTSTHTDRQPQAKSKSFKMRQHLESFGAVVCVDEAAFGTNKVYHAVQHMPDLVTLVFSVILSRLPPV